MILYFLASGGSIVLFESLRAANRKAESNVFQANQTTEELRRLHATALVQRVTDNTQMLDRLRVGEAELTRSISRS